MAFYPAMSMGERIHFVRENCGDLSQDEFANKLGLTKSAISGYETGRRIPPDNVLKHIACVFHLDEDWLKDGVGEPFFPTPEDALEELFDQFECSDFERSFLTAYFYMEDKDRREFSNYLEKFFNKMMDAVKEKELKAAAPKAVAPEFLPPPVTPATGTPTVSEKERKAMREKVADMYEEQNQAEEKPDTPASSANGSAVG